MRVEHSKVVRRNINIRIGQSEEHSAVNSRVTHPGGDVGLDGIGGAVLEADVLERREGNVELGYPGGELGLLDVGGGDVAVVIERRVGECGFFLTEVGWWIGVRVGLW